MEYVRLGDVCRVVSGSTPKSEVAEFWDGTIKWITPAEIHDDTYIVMDTERHITKRAIEKTHLTLLPVGTVLLSSRAPIGKTAIVGAEMYCNQGFKNLICSDRIFNRYLYFFLTARTNYLNDLGRGATFKEISKTIVENIEIPLPELDGQKKIVARLEKIEVLMANRKKVIAWLKKIVQARFWEMFGDPRKNKKDRKTSALENIADVGSSKRVFTTELKTSGVPFYRGTEIGQLAEGKLLQPELFIAPEHYQRLCEESGTPQQGDLLMPSICPDGRIWRVDTNRPFYFKDGRVLWISKITNSVDSLFLQFLLKFLFIQDFDQLASGTTFKELKIFILKKIPIIIPPLPLQQKFAAFVRQADAARCAAEAQFSALATLRAKVLQDAFGA